jgi:CelD/BcsL family acetyltransferase involved in cellulose biosynthesis
VSTVTRSVDRHQSIEALAREWDELADQLSSPPWSRPEWFSAWWTAFGRGALEVFSVRENGRLIGVVPVAVERDRLNSPSNWHTPEFGLLGEPTAMAPLAHALFGDGPERVSLAFVVEGRDVDAVRTAAHDAKYRWLARPLERSPYITIDGDWQHYEARRSRKLLGELRRRRRRLNEKGDFSFECVDGSEDLDGLLDDGFRIEAAGWKGARGSAISSKEETDRFYRTVARWAADRGWLRLAFLRLDGRPFAFDLCFECDGVHYLMKTGFDPDFGRFAPGMILRHEMLSRAFGLGLHSYEFLGANEAWKLDWAEETRERCLLQAFARSPRGLLDWAANEYGRRLARVALRRRA